MASSSSTNNVTRKFIVSAKANEVPSDTEILRAELLAISWVETVVTLPGGFAGFSADGNLDLVVKTGSLDD
ncbi:MAG: hypothetical protein KJI69_00975 [Patescibacteria group bacterium]|nr:hypothetical protein [Patescibacteria group bacterium]